MVTFFRSPVVLAGGGGEGVGGGVSVPEPLEEPRGRERSIKGGGGTDGAATIKEWPGCAY